ncbi:MAG TPA: hypothetical protein VFH61_06230, partial [Thermoleophilia bacterium]|nr:hypothetical protein [Thermoleophilia bacterium]
MATRAARMMRTSPEDLTGPIEAHIITLQDVTRGLGLDQSDAGRIERLIADSSPEFTQKSQTQRIMHARQRLLAVTRTMKHVPADTRDELTRRATAYWKRNFQTDYGKSPTVRFREGATMDKSEGPIPVLTVARLTEPLEKAGARGGKYYRRVPNPGYVKGAKGSRGSRWIYYYTKSAYDKAHGHSAHVHGPEQLSLFDRPAEKPKAKPTPKVDPEAAKREARYQAGAAEREKRANEPSGYGNSPAELAAQKRAQERVAREHAELMARRGEAGARPVPAPEPAVLDPRDVALEDAHKQRLATPWADLSAADKADLADEVKMAWAEGRGKRLSTAKAMELARAEHTRQVTETARDGVRAAAQDGFSIERDLRKLVVPHDAVATSSAKLSSMHLDTLKQVAAGGLTYHQGASWTIEDLLKNGYVEVGPGNKLSATSGGNAQIAGDNFETMPESRPAAMDRKRAEADAAAREAQAAAKQRRDAQGRAERERLAAGNAKEKARLEAERMAVVEKKLADAKAKRVAAANADEAEGGSTSTPDRWAEQRERLNREAGARSEGFQADQAAARVKHPDARFSSKPATHERAMEHAEKLAELMRAGGVNSAKAWGKHGKGARVYLPGSQYLSIGMDGSVSTSQRGRQVYDPSGLWPKQRKAVSDARSAHHEWHLAAMVNEESAAPAADTPKVHYGPPPAPVSIGAMDLKQAESFLGRFIREDRTSGDAFQRKLAQRAIENPDNAGRLRELLREAYHKARESDPSRPKVGSLRAAASRVWGSMLHSEARKRAGMVGPGEASPSNFETMPKGVTADEHQAAEDSAPAAGPSLLDAASLFGEQATAVSPALPAAAAVMRDAVRGTLLRVGGVTYRVFSNAGDMVKNVVVHGSKGRKFYELRVTDPTTYNVGVFEVLSQVGSGELAKEPRSSGNPVKVGQATDADAFGSSRDNFETMPKGVTADEHQLALDHGFKPSKYGNGWEHPDGDVILINESGGAKGGIHTTMRSSLSPGGAAVLLGRTKLRAGESKQAESASWRQNYERWYVSKKGSLPAAEDMGVIEPIEPKLVVPAGKVTKDTLEAQVRQRLAEEWAERDAARAAIDRGEDPAKHGYQVFEGKNGAPPGGWPEK